MLVPPQRMPKGEISLWGSFTSCRNTLCPFNGRWVPARELSRETRTEAQRDMTAEEAKKKYPNLDARLNRISDEIRQARSTGKRFAYKKPLKALYKLAYHWSENDRLDERMKIVAILREIQVR